MGRLYREVLEWFADSSKRVQYPAPELKRPDADFAQPEKPRFGFKYKMPLWRRALIFTLSTAGLMIGLVLLVISCVLVAGIYHVVFH